MPGKFIVTKTPKGFYRFSLLASNHQKVLTSQNYASLSNCRAGIEAMKKNASSHIEDLTLQRREEKSSPKYEVYLDKADLFRYRLMAGNGQNIAIAEEGYSSKQACINGIKSIVAAAEGAEVDESALKQ
ncbi:MAG: YegP family protein [Spirochaetota bacterium]